MVMRGINKKVIIIKNFESDFIEEAHFILKNRQPIFSGLRENEMVSEANRIISEYHSQQKAISEKNTKQNIPQKDNPAQRKADNMKHFEKNMQKNEKHTSESKSENDEKNAEADEIFGDDKNKKPNTRDFDALYDEQQMARHAFYLDPEKSRSGNHRSRRLQMPPKSFFAGIGAMSALILLIRLIEALLIGR